jgi:putative sigma-54 modulation protein
MRISITARHFKLSEELKDFTESEVHRLKKYYDEIIDVEVILGWEKNDRIAEINLIVNGNQLTAHERSEEMSKSINVAVDRLERQLIKYRDRRRSFDHEKLGTREEVKSSMDFEEDEL